MRKEILPTPQPPPPGNYETVLQWCARTGMGVRLTCTALTRGDLRGKQIGSFVMIDVDHGLRWLESLRAAAAEMTLAAEKPTIITAFEHLRAWRKRTGMTPGMTRRAVKSGDLWAKQVDGELLIDVQQGLHWLKSLPSASGSTDAKPPHATMAAKPPAAPSHAERVSAAAAASNTVLRKRQKDGKPKTRRRRRAARDATAKATKPPRRRTPRVHPLHPPPSHQPHKRKGRTR